jgi:hypothetical protein
MLQLSFEFVISLANNHVSDVISWLFRDKCGHPLSRTIPYGDLTQIYESR